MARRVMKKVFLTGASSGIGLAIANSLTERGDDSGNRASVIQAAVAA